MPTFMLVGRGSRILSVALSSGFVVEARRSDWSLSGLSLLLGAEFLDRLDCPPRSNPLSIASRSRSSVGLLFDEKEGDLER